MSDLRTSISRPYLPPPPDVGEFPGGYVIPATHVSTIAYRMGQVVKHQSDYYRAINDVPRGSVSPADDTDNWVQITDEVEEAPFEQPGMAPGAVAYFQQRLIFAGSSAAPNTVWASAVGDMENFFPGAYDSEPWTFDLISDKADIIQWISSREVIVVGSASNEWVLVGGSQGITPSFIDARRQTTIGSAPIQGTMANENIVFVQRGDRKVREYQYQNELQAYRSPDLTFFSDHILKGRAQSMAWQSDPDPILWLRVGDGTLAAMTYDNGKNLAGWHRHVTQGEIESMCVVPGKEDDEIWIAVKRVVNGNTVRYLERSATRRPARQDDAFHVDSGITLDGGPPMELSAATAADPVEVTVTDHGLTTGDLVRMTDIEGMTELEGRGFAVTVVDANTFTLDNEDGTGLDPATAGNVTKVYARVDGLDHLEGEEVAVAVDGGPHARRTVESGEITLDAGTYGNVIHVGLPYDARVQTMNILAAAPEAKRGRIHRARIRFIESTQAKVGAREDLVSEIIFREPTTPYGQVAQMFTGEKSVELTEGHGTDKRVFIMSDQPTPLTIAVILPELGAYAGGG